MSKTTLDDLIERVRLLTPQEQKEIERDVMESTAGQRYFPNPGPQTEAWFCEADELFYGGQAGGGKSSLSCGLAVESHERSLILRRMRADSKKLAEAELLDRILNGNRDCWNGGDLLWREGNHKIQFGGCELEADKQRYKGDPNDLIVFDEVTDFLESQYVFITIWNRSATPGQRCRVVATGNPPTTAEGLWVIRRWGPWLDPKHPRPAKPGELRWYISDEQGVDTEVDGPGPHVVGDREVRAKSRTFIPASLDDNPDLAADGEYARILDALPKDLRDAYRDGRFDLGLKDDPFQLFPTTWVQEAQKRWTVSPPDGIPMCSLGVDVAQGGVDNNIIQPRYGHWFATPVVVPGRETPLGVSQAGLIVTNRRDNAVVILDCSGGYGGVAYKDLTVDNSVEVVAYVASLGSKEHTNDKAALEFVNLRAQAAWRFREALDPTQRGGSIIALPPDPEMLSDLASMHYEVKRGKIQVEDKDEIKKRIGRSPDKGDAVILAWIAGAKQADSASLWSRRNAPPQVNMGRRGTVSGTRTGYPKVVTGRRSH